MGTRRLLIVLLAGLVLSVGGGVALRDQRPTDSPLLAFSRPAETTTSDAPPTTEPAATPAPVVAKPARPISPPQDANAAEPIVQIGTIEIPKIGLVSPIFHGISLRNIDQGPSHWPGTAFPGENGNTVFAGHRVTHTHPFLRINELVEGDQVFFDIQGTRSTYVVTGHEIVFPNRLDIVNQTETPTGTLFACHPPHSAAQRYVVHLALVTS